MSFTDLVVMVNVIVIFVLFAGKSIGGYLQYKRDRKHYDKIKVGLRRTEKENL